MISMPVLFWIFVILFAVVGAMRGWAKEIMVTFSVVLAIFLITVLETYVPIVRNLLGRASPTALFWMRAIIVMLLAFFGYQSPNLKGLAGARFAREKFQDVLLGFLLGAFNGYLIFGTLWFYYAQAGYPYPNIIIEPQAGTQMAQLSTQMLKRMPPNYLIPPWIYFAVGIAFLFVIVVFL
jgi:uncharacterized membrane protein required for colicin V production